MDEEAATGAGDPDTAPAGSVAGRSQIEVEEDLGARGFCGQFGARPDRRILCFTCHREFGVASLAGDLRPRRVEGESDPADMAIVVPLVCPHCGAAGTLALQYGPMASIEEVDVITALSNQGVDADGARPDPAQE